MTYKDKLDLLKSIESIDPSVGLLPKTYAEDKNCLSYWFPRLEGAGLPVPKTEIIFTEVQLLDFCDMEIPKGIEGLERAIKEAGDRLGWPCFLRTGQTSCKHNWEKGPFLESDEDIRDHIIEITNFSGIVDLNMHVWCVREMLPTKPLYRCTKYGNMPVVREARAFVSGGRVLYINPYWPIKALEEGQPDKSDWASNYENDHGFSEPCLDSIRELAKAANTAVPGDWSVDILDVDGDWYITDMAIAQLSYGYKPEFFQ